MFGPALQPWYLTLFLPLYVFLRGDPGWNRVWLVVVAAFALLAPLQDILPSYVSMAVVGVPLWFAWRALARRGIDPLPASDPERDPFKTPV